MFNFLNNDYPEILEGVVRQAEMLVDLDRILAFCIIPVLIYSSVGLLGFQLPHVLFSIGTPIAPD